jgi:hypothetical protein
LPTFQIRPTRPRFLTSSRSHSHYTVQLAKTLIQGQVELYDKYDKTNNKAGHTYLLASLTPLLSKKVSKKLDDADLFPIAWLQFLKAIQFTSIKRFEDLKTSIKLRLPSQYPCEQPSYSGVATTLKGNSSRWEVLYVYSAYCAQPQLWVVGSLWTRHGMPMVCVICVSCESVEPNTILTTRG